MPQHYIFETAITIDHETGEMRVDTTREGVASYLRRMQFREVTKESSKPYRRFIGEADQIRFRKPKAQRPARGFGRKCEPGIATPASVPEKRNHGR